jgi:hypothetical protein
MVGQTGGLVWEKMAGQTCGLAWEKMGASRLAGMGKDG